MATTANERQDFQTLDTISYIWRCLGLPPSTIISLDLPGSDDRGLPSSFKIGHLAQASIALSALSAALIHSLRTEYIPVRKVRVHLSHAIDEFRSERLLTIDGKSIVPTRPPIGGLHKTVDGYIRIHDGFPNHREGTKRLLGSPGPDDRAAIAAKVSKWKSEDLETAAANAGLAMAALRTVEEWDALPQALAISDFPILIRKLSDGPPGLPEHLRTSKPDKCLRGLRVVEMTRVIAAPVAGRTLAAHGADVLWVTSPTLPDLPEIDRDTARGKRSISLDINQASDLQTLKDLLQEADVFIQSYRPGSLASRGLALSSLADAANQAGKSIICANLSAHGPVGPWSQRRGFDSLVQTSSGLNTEEANRHGIGEVARVLPCQALDHASGYFLATGINAALYRQVMEGGSYEVDVSLAGTMKYLRSLGQWEGRSGFDVQDRDGGSDTMERRDSEFGTIEAVKHSAMVDGVEVGFERMPRILGSDEAVWLAD